MKITHFVIACLGAFLLACAPLTKQQYLNELETFTDESGAHCDSYTDREWASRNEQMKEYLGEQYQRFEADLTPKEKAHVWAQALVYYTCQYKEDVVDRIREADEAELEKLRENIELIADSGEEFLDEVLPELEKLGPELRDAGKEFARKLEKSGIMEQLEESLDKLGKKLQEVDLE